MSCNAIVPRRLLLAALLALLCAAAAPALTLKLGTAAPINSPWDLVLRRLAADWFRISDGDVELKIFPGGIAGDEPDMIRKMRIGQLHAATLTAGSMNDIYPGVLALAAPMLIRSNEEMIARAGRGGAVSGATPGATRLRGVDVGAGRLGQVFRPRAGAQPRRHSSSDPLGSATPMRPRSAPGSRPASRWSHCR